jgi:hypothetical protein
MRMPLPDPALLARKAEIVRALQRIVPGEGVVSEPAELVPFESDALSACRQAPLTVVLPETTAQVSAVLAWCQANGVKVAPPVRRVVQDRVGPEAVAPGGGMDQHRRLGILEAGGDLSRVQAHGAVGVDHRLGQARGTRGQQILGVLFGCGDRRSVGSAMEIIQGEVAGPSVPVRDHGQASQRP